MKVLLACGGTGGHLFPGMALAEAFEKKVPGIEIVFVGTPRGLEKEVIPKTKWRLEMIESISLADKKGLGKIMAGISLLKALSQSRRLIRKEEPDLVVGVGGYAAGPVLMMASLMHKPTLTIEPNAVAGMANRLLKPFVDRVVVAYPKLAKTFGDKKTRVLGVPVRESILKEATQIAPEPNKKTIFIFGGSQGAKTINEGILNALPLLKGIKERVHFIHQIGRKTSAVAVEKAYRDLGFSAEVYPFIDKMGPFYGRADLVISRAGANALAEIVALAKPSLLIPYPFSAAGHQEKNASYLDKMRGAKMLLDKDVNGKTMAELIRAFVTIPDVLQEMKKKLQKLKGNEAAQKIVEECLELMRRERNV